MDRGSAEKPKRWEAQEIKPAVPIGDFPSDHFMIAESGDRPAFNQVSGHFIGFASVEDNPKTISLQGHGSVWKRTVGIGCPLKINGGFRKKQFREPSRVGQEGLDGFTFEFAVKDKPVWSGEEKGFFRRPEKAEGCGVRHKLNDFFMSISSSL